MKKLINFFSNIWWYRKELYCDKEDDFIFINILVLKKLEKIYKYWGTCTNYIGDYDDKQKLKELIKELKELIGVQKNIEDEKILKSLNITFYSKFGSFMTELWD